MYNLDLKYILNNVLKRIEAISNKDYQKRIWIEGKGPECDDFDETAEYFLLEGESIVKNYKEFGLTDNQYQLLKKLLINFDTFSNSPERGYLPQVFIESPEWTNITELAKEVLKAFDWKLPSRGHLC
jgi:hypothetical protein